MASSITLTSAVLKGSRYFQLECTQKSNGSAENSSTVTWKLSALGDSVYYDTGPTTVVINGTTVYSKARTGWENGKFPVAQGSTSGTIDIPHNNDGTKKITVKFITAVYTTTQHEYSDEWTLDSIPRYGTVSHSLNAKTETTVKMNWSSDSTIDYLWYSKDNGSNWTGVNVTDGKSGTYTISGLTANKEYKIKTRVRRKDSQLTTDSSALSVTTYDYPHCTNAPNFVIGQPVTLTFYNPLGRTFDFIIYGNGEHIYAWSGLTGTTYKGVTEEEVVGYLYDSIPNAKSAKYSVETVYNDVFVLKQGGTYSVDESKCKPTFTTFTYKDTNSTVTAVTGNNQVLVKGLSTLSVDITTANKMTAKNSADPDYYNASIDTLSVSKDYNETATVTIPVGTVSSVGTKRLNVRAYDIRGISTEVHKDVTVYDYAKPTINASATRLNNFEAQTTLKISGEYSRLTIGGADKNTIQTVKYRYREKNGTWTSAVTVTATKTEGKFTCSDITLSLDNTKAFEIEVSVTDKLGSNTRTIAVDIGQAIFFVSSNKRKCYINGEEVVPLSKIHPVGSVICTATNVNPSGTYGGTWTLVDKGFKSYSANDTDGFTVGTNVTGTGTYISRGGNTIRVRQSFTINADVNDSGLSLGNFNWETIGISQLPMGYNGIMAYSDVANGGIVCNIAYDSGSLTLVDVFDVTPIPSGSTFAVDFTFVSLYTQMLDSVCDKFYWKRTA